MATTYTLISSQVLGSSATSVTFSSIPSTYTDLMVLVSARNSRAQAPDNLSWTYNGVTSAVYSDNWMTGNGTGAGAGSNTNNNYNYAPNVIDANTATSNTFGSVEIYIGNYLSSLYKAVSSTGAQENNQTQAYMAATAHLWGTFNSINSLTFSSPSGASLVSGSSFYLYGIKNS